MSAETMGAIAPATVEAASTRRHGTADRHWRSLVKAATWRVTGSIDTFLVGWLITGKPAVAGSIAGVEVVTKIGLYYLHERAWNWLPWGKGRARLAE